MQRRFNEGRYWERMQRGEFEERIVEFHPSTRYPEVIARHPGAVSVTTHYLDRNGLLVAELHYFRMPDGSVIPNKRPDPKLLFEDGVLYHQEKAKAREARLKAEMRCQRCHAPAMDAAPPQVRTEGRRDLVKITCTAVGCRYEMWRAF